MPARLIVNADDFGLTPGINRAIAELHDAGALTSTTLMASCSAFDDAVAIARARPSLGVGCHITLVDGEPTADPSTIPTLLDSGGRSFRQSLVGFALAVTLGVIHEDDITREAVAQIRKLQHAGICVTHVDTHKHTHILSRVARPLLKALEQTSIAAIRNPFEPRWSSTLSGTPRRSLLVRALQRKRRRFESLAPLAHDDIRTTHGTVGISATGHLNADTLRAFLSTMPSGTWELVCHPGYNDRDLDAITTRLRTEREIELRALLAAFNPSSSDPLNPSGLQLINYAGLAHTPVLIPDP